MRRSLLLLAVSLAALAVATLSGGGGGGGGVGGGVRDGGGAGGAGSVAPNASLAGRVVRVVDGDTVRVAVDGRREERVRYIGIDTPESVRPDTPVQCFAHRAAAENARLVGGARVRLVLDVEGRDRFGRLLAYVYRARDGLFVNEALVRGGFARPLTIPPNVRFAARFVALAARARRDGRGLWSACARE
jgi:endonuclease YncB( thermonuclease family)